MHLLFVLIPMNPYGILYFETFSFLMLILFNHFWCHLSSSICAKNDFNLQHSNHLCSLKILTLNPRFGIYFFSIVATDRQKKLNACNVENV